MEGWEQFKRDKPKSVSDLPNDHLLNGDMRLLLPTPWADVPLQDGELQVSHLGE